MLARELRRDIPSSSREEDATTRRHRQQDQTNQDTTTGRFHVNGVEPSAPPLDGHTDTAAPNTIPDDRDHMPPIPDLPEHDDDSLFDIDDDFTWTERMRRFKSRIAAKYQNLSDDYKAISQVLVILLILYVGFGGRFGIGSSSSRRGTNAYGSRGNYGDGNAYDEYYNKRPKKRSTYAYSSGSNARKDYDDYGYYDSTNNRQSSYSGYHQSSGSRARRQRQSSTSYSGNNSTVVIMILFAILLVLQYAGFISMQTVNDLIWILGGLGARQRRFRGGVFGGNRGFGYGGGFGHGGIGRRRGGFRFGNMRF